jgi:alpha,alpha-trehalase
MKPAFLILHGASAACLLAAVAAFSQTVPVADNLWRLVAQEDTDGDRKITVHDHTTPFVIHDQNGAAARTLTNFYQMSVLLQELKRADDQHEKETTMDNLQLDESAVDRTHRFIKDYFWNALTRRV